MKNSPAYIASLVLTIALTLLAVFTLLPLFGVISLRTFAPLSTLLLVGLTALNCTLRAQRLRKAREAAMEE